jgi:two-component system sensor histidine kinase KdpD
MDVEAVLARRPGLAIVDDLPHSNAPGSRHRKRHEDAAELLAAGVDVISAMDVAQVESLNDVVERTTGMQVRETVPDTFLRAAEDVVCLDVTVDDLAQRLRAGRIVTAEPVAEASGGALRPDRLAALRELALREAAEHVRRPPAGPLPPQVAGRLMVALSSLSPRASTLLRRGARLAGA